MGSAVGSLLAETALWEARRPVFDGPQSLGLWIEDEHLELAELTMELLMNAAGMERPF